MLSALHRRQHRRVPALGARRHRVAALRLSPVQLQRDRKVRVPAQIVGQRHLQQRALRNLRAHLHLLARRGRFAPVGSGARPDHDLIRLDARAANALEALRTRQPELRAARAQLRLGALVVAWRARHNVVELVLVRAIEAHAPPRPVDGAVEHPDLPERERDTGVGHGQIPGRKPAGERGCVRRLEGCQGFRDGSAQSARKRRSCHQRPFRDDRSGCNLCLEVLVRRLEANNF
mmetsp:Transcript_62521/g.147017  ORF Transcript_62521/g.147017 Transcript_62521/m.147017 type:complete len:233 (+) Transcript_62521:1483-2181(+)